MCSVASVNRAGRIRADKVACDEIPAVRLHHDADAKAVNDQSADRAVAGVDGQPGYATRASAVQLDLQRRVVAQSGAIRIGSRPRLRVAVYDDRVGDRGQCGEGSDSSGRRRREY